MSKDSWHAGCICICSAEKKITNKQTKGETKMKEGYKLVIFANSIFDEGKKGPVRKVKFEIQQYGISFKRCRYCGVNEVLERYFIPQSYLNPTRFLEIDLIQLTYLSSPRGAHSIIVNDNDYYNSGKDSKLPNTYKGWGSYPSNLYIPIKGKYIAIEENDIQVIAVRDEIETNNLLNYIGEITAGEGGQWKLYINIDFEKKKIEPELFGHPSCIGRMKFSELEYSDLVRGINRGYFNEITKNTYVSAGGSEVWYRNKIYVPYKTDKGTLVLLSEDFTGLDENYEPVYWDRDSSERVRVYYDSNFERGTNFDFAERGEISVTKDKEEIEEAG